MFIGWDLLFFPVNNNAFCTIGNSTLCGFIKFNYDFWLEIILSEWTSHSEAHFWWPDYQIRKPEIRLNFQIDQKDNNVLLLIKEIFGGNIGYRSSQNTYYYGSTSFGSAKKVIKYFDNFHLQSSKHNNYLKWRKAYIMVQAKDHLTEKGIDKIYKLKNSMNRNSE